MTVLEAIRKSADFLEKKGVESPRLQAELLLSHVLKLPRLKLYLEFERLLKEEEAGQFREYIKRRAQGEPLQRLMGSASFCGYEIATPAGALIPRPETEILAELGWTFLRSLAKPQPMFLEFGAGTGCVSIAIALQTRGARGFAVEVSPAAVEIARSNIARLGANVTAIEGDGFKSLPAGQRFDLIAANPPYIPSAEIERLAIEVRGHDPREALDGGEDGLEFYRRLAIEARERLEEGGRFMAEFGDGQESAVSGIFERADWIVEEIRADYTARPRFIIARRA